MKTSDMINFLQEILNVLPALQLPSTKNNLQILLLTTERVEGVMEELKKREKAEQEEDDELAVSAEEI